MEADDNTSLRVASFSCYLDTAKENLVHRVSAQETAVSPAKPPFTIKFSRSKDGQDSPSLRLDSFSCLNSAGDHNFVFEVPGPVQDPTSAFTFSHHETPKDGEIGVFNADKYFNMKLEDRTESKLGYNNEGPANVPISRPNFNPRTPSLCSEASTWNSQAILLPDLHRCESLAKQKKAIGRRIFPGFGCRGPCFDRKSVHINEIVTQAAHYTSKSSRIGSERIGSARIDHLLGAEEMTVKKQLIKGLDQSRPSIEVFGSGNTSKGSSDVATNMERKLSMLTWDAIPKGRAIPTSSTLGSCTICDDMASEASSDLFEIENISGSVFPLVSVSADDASTCMSPTSIYAPSEASIQWSVVTASAADYSTLSDCIDEASVSVAGDMVARKSMNRSSKMRVDGGKEVKRSGPGGLLGCKSHKALDVAENVCLKGGEKVGKSQPRTRSFEI